MWNGMKWSCVDVSFKGWLQEGKTFVVRMTNAVKKEDDQVQSAWRVQEHVQEGLRHCEDEQEREGNSDGKVDYSQYLVL